ncbi:MAG: hypothetical protein JWM00_471 [Candidatus Saccharibacteria bacterium]|nr:hypothetical protein [Candidatus Saccharibacteria bacterium]
MSTNDDTSQFGSCVEIAVSLTIMGIGILSIDYVSNEDGSTIGGVALVLAFLFLVVGYILTHEPEKDWKPD